jgi:hypothetical protein
LTAPCAPMRRLRVASINLRFPKKLKCGSMVKDEAPETTHNAIAARKAKFAAIVRPSISDSAAGHIPSAPAPGGHSRRAYGQSYPASVVIICGEPDQPLCCASSFGLELGTFHGSSEVTVTETAVLSLSDAPTRSDRDSHRRRRHFRPSGFQLFGRTRSRIQDVTVARYRSRFKSLKSDSSPSPG